METNCKPGFRVESDLIGPREIPDNLLYGVQTLRGIENFEISHLHLDQYPEFIKGLAITKMGAARANYSLGLLTKEQAEAICSNWKNQNEDVYAYLMDMLLR